MDKVKFLLGKDPSSHFSLIGDYKIRFINDMKQFYSQVDESCGVCGCELPRGSWAYENYYEDLFCEDCEEIEKD